MQTNVITILCSGVALGVYIPAILTDYQLKKKGFRTEVVVLENLLLDEKKTKIKDNKKAFHQSFRVALAGQKLARDLMPLMDMDYVNEMLNRWALENRRNFIVFSGFWMSVIQEYLKRIEPENANVDIVHMDADISASWKQFKEAGKAFNNIWLFSCEERRLIYEIPVSEEKPLNFKERDDRFVVHGGGWGMGTYQSKIPELDAMGMNLDIVAYDYSETIGIKKGNRTFMIDPQWAPWLKNKDGLHEFPLFGEVVEGKKPTFKNKPEHHEFYDVISLSKGIVSKPGGATMLDSLSSATPMIMLEPFGDYEQKNSELWSYLGFGISYDKWKETGFSIEILEKLHNNLLNTRGTLKNYVSSYEVFY